MQSIIILILLLLFILYLYGEYQLKFGNRMDNYIKILEKLTLLLAIVAIISRKWWLNVIVFILIIVLVISPGRALNFFRKAFNKLGNLFKKQKS